MGILSKIKYVIRVFFHTPEKKKLIVKSLRVLKSSGVSGLKYAIKAREQKNNGMVDLYKKQQDEKHVYQEYSETVLFVIIATSDMVEQSDTYRFINEQKKVNDKVIVIELNEHASIRDALLHVKYNCDYVFVIKEGDYLAPNMRDEFAEAMCERKYDVIYSDECIFCHDDGKVCKYSLKSGFHKFDLFQKSTDWNAVMFSINTFEKVVLDVNAKTLENVIFEMLMNAVLKKAMFYHIDRVLLLRKDSMVQCNLMEQRMVLEKALKMEKIKANVIIANETLKICAYEERKKTSIIIVAYDVAHAEQTVESVLANTGNVEYEIIVVIDDENLLNAENIKRKSTLVRIISCERELTYTQRCNLAAKEAVGDILVFMQDNLKIQQPEWLNWLNGVFTFPMVGAASPKVLRSDSTVRYAGIIAGGFGFTPIPFNGQPNCYTCNVNEPVFYNHRTSVLSASCIAIRASIFDMFEGFDIKNFDDKFSNAQLSFEVQRAGYICVYCAEAEIVAIGDEWYDSWYDKEHQSAYINLLRIYGEELSEDCYFTTSMKYQYLKGVPVDFRIYQKKNNNVERKERILVISHDSLLGGATIALQYATRTLKKCGYYVAWLVENEGPMLGELERDEITYVVDSSFRGSDEWLKYAVDFDLIFCSTITLCAQVEKLKNFGKKVVWWVHEANDYYKKEWTSLFTRKEIQNVQVLCGGTYAEKTFQSNFAGIETEVLLYGVPDYAKNRKAEPEEIISNPDFKMIFLSIGTIESRKGQDILVEAIDFLKTEVREKCLFVFIGKAIEENIFEKVMQAKEKYPQEIVWLESVNREILMKIYCQGDAVICTSREDPMPVFMTECLMQSKVAICSENTGTASILTDGYDGYVYRNNSPAELAERIARVVTKQKELDEMKTNARTTYENFFSMEVFEKNIQYYVEKILKE